MQITNHPLVHQKEGSNLLNDACKTGNLELVMMALRQGARPDSQTLTSACKSGNTRIIETVKQQGATPDHETLNVACTTRKVEVVQWAIFCGAQANNKTVVIANKTGDKTIIDLVCNALPKVEIATQAISPSPDPGLRKTICGAAEWRTYIGDPGNEPPIPEGIEKWLESNPSFCLYLIPYSINGEIISYHMKDGRYEFNTYIQLAKFFQAPRQGKAIKGISCRYSNLNIYPPFKKSYWALMSQQKLSGTENKIFKDQKQFLSGFGYEPPSFTEIMICMCMQYVQHGQSQSGSRFSDDLSDESNSSSFYGNSYHAIMNPDGMLSIIIKDYWSYKADVGMHGVIRYNFTPLFEEVGKQEEL